MKTMDVESFYYHMRPPEGGIFDQGQEPEEQFCPKCDELVEECECAYFDKLEESEI